MTAEQRKRAEIFELQTMLRTIAQAERWMPILNPDGLFDGETTKAVRRFQESRGLPSTGKVDFETWTSIVNAYQYVLYITSSGGGIYPFPRRGYVTSMGEKSDLIAIIQIMLSSLAVAYDLWVPIPLTGVYDEATAALVKQFQKANLLNVSGLVDMETWDALAQSYNEFVNNRYYEG